MPPTELALIGVVIFVLLNLYTYLYALIIAVLAALQGLKVEEISLGFGPPLATFRLLGRNIRLGALPLGSSVRFTEGAQGFEALPASLRLFYRVAGEVIIFATAIAALPISAIDFAQQVVSAIGGLFVSPTEAARAIASEIARTIQTETVGQTVARAFALQAIINLLPIPPLNGGIFCIDLIRWITGLSLNWLTTGPVLLISLLVVLYGYGWTIAGFFLI